MYFPPRQPPNHSRPSYSARQSCPPIENSELFRRWAAVLNMHRLWQGIRSGSALLCNRIYLRESHMGSPLHLSSFSTRVIYLNSQSNRHWPRQAFGPSDRDRSPVAAASHLVTASFTLASRSNPQLRRHSASQV